MEKIWSWFEKLVPPFPQEDGTKIPRSLVKFILYYSRGLYKFLFVVAVLSAIMAAGEALFFSCMGLIVDWTSSTTPADFFRLYKDKLIIMLVLAGIILPLATLFHSLLLHQTISSNYPMQIRWSVHRYMLGQSLAFFSDEFAGRVANKVMQTAMAVRTSVLKLIDVLSHMIVYLITMLYMLADADLYLAVPLLIWLVLYTIAIFIFIPKLREQARIQADTRSDMVGRIVDSYVNIAIVKLFGGKGKEAKYARVGMENFIKTEYQALRTLTMFDISVQFLNYALLISTTTLALILWSNYWVSTGAIAVSVAISIRIINMSRWMMWEIGAIFENIGMVYDGINTISKPILVQDPKDPKYFKDIKGNIDIKNISFSYLNKKDIFHNFSLSIKAGERVGVVGPSGAGKSTLVNLILRFYDVKEGGIYLDGINIKDVLQDDLRDNFAMVSQDTSLMHRTVAENISYGSLDSTNNKLEKAARLTDSLSFIKSLSDYRGGQGFSTMVGERGVKLSGGQRQRIAIARVIMKNAKILILDEATSALDSESERVVQANLEHIMENRTVIAIAHRLSTLSKMDRIIVLDEGKIVEQGTHDDLIHLDGLYARLWKRQSGGFLGQ